MKDQEVEILIIKFLENRITNDEIRLLEDWLKHSTNKSIFDEYVKIHYSLTTQSFSHTIAFKNFRRKIHHIQRKNRIHSVMKYAAVFIGLLVLGYGGMRILNNSSLTSINEKITQSKDLPSHNKATLTLEDGSIVELQNGELYQDEHRRSTGNEITYSSVANEPDSREIKYNYLTVPRGGQFFLTLEDGTKVWLNSESQLKYPIRFLSNASRKVELVYGEAFFEVSPSVEHGGADFIVRSTQQDVQVLGTSFNLKAYKDENIASTILVEGKIKLLSGGEQLVLSPGEQSTLTYDSHEIKIEIVNVDDIASWRFGVFNFKNMTLHEIMKVLSRWYDVDVQFQSFETREERFTGVLGKEQSLKEILTILKETNGVDYMVKKDILIIK